MSAYLDLIFLALLVVIVLLRLNGVLGTRPEKTQIKIVSKKEFEKIYNMIQNGLEEAQTQEKAPVFTSPVDHILIQIPNFNKASFIKRAAKVFEMLLTAFANRDKETLKMLTAPKLYEKFAQIIDEREKLNITAETDLIKIDAATIEDAKITGKGFAKICVRFISDQINLLKNDKGEVIEGDENFVQKITDVWTFEKQLSSPSPVWLLTSTKKK